MYPLADGAVCRRAAAAAAVAAAAAAAAAAAGEAGGGRQEANRLQVPLCNCGDMLIVATCFFPLGPAAAHDALVQPRFLLRAVPLPLRHPIIARLAHAKRLLKTILREKRLLPRRPHVNRAAATQLGQ